MRTSPASVVPTSPSATSNAPAVERSSTSAPRPAQTGPQLALPLEVAAFAPVRQRGAAQAALAATSLRPLATRSAADVERYYATAQGKQGAALTSALHDIVTRGHHDLGYSAARDELFTHVDDPDGDHVVTELYTGAQVAHVDGRKSAYDHGLNTEHTWPQSLGARGIAQADLHQLQPADIEINGRRGNYGYGELSHEAWRTPVGPTGEFSRLGTDASGETVFEPRASVRGDIARGLLYFYTRYDDDRPADFTLASFQHELPTLLKWNHDDPVDEPERTRNDRIDAIQGNRNPFVDHPEWADVASFDDPAARRQLALV
jgi:endonuclease I